MDAGQLTPGQIVRWQPGRQGVGTLRRADRAANRAGRLMDAGPIAGKVTINHERNSNMNTALTASIAMALDVIPDADLYTIHLAAALYGKITPEASSFPWLLENELVDSSGVFKHKEETIAAVTSVIAERKGAA